jgi:enamine deaminase RidA (YjgF/YER057c/UK114 family)
MAERESVFSEVTAPVSSPGSAPVSRRNPSTLWDMASGGYSQISVAEPGRLAFLSGQVAWRPSGEAAPKDLAGQAKIATANLAAALKELEASEQDIVMLRVYVVDATTDAFLQVMAALSGLVGEAKPSITTIGVQALYSPDILVEIEMTVRVP